MSVSKNRAASRHITKVSSSAERTACSKSDARKARLHTLLEQATEHLSALLTVQHVADFLDMSKRSVYRYVELGELTTVATGVAGSGNVRILKSSLIDMLLRQTLARHEAVPHQAKALDRAEVG